MKQPGRIRFGGGQSERNIAVYDVEPKFLQAGRRRLLDLTTNRKPKKKWPFKRKAATV